MYGLRSLIQSQYCVISVICTPACMTESYEFYIFLTFWVLISAVFKRCSLHSLLLPDDRIERLIRLDTMSVDFR
jgi:hypothetical protein